MVTGERQAVRIRNLYLRAILRQDIGYFDREAGTGEIIERMSTDTIIIQDAMGEKVHSKSNDRALILHCLMMTSFLHDRKTTDREVLTAFRIVLWRICDSIYKGMASYYGHAFCYPSSRYLCCVYVCPNGEAEITRTNCVFSCSYCCRTNNWLNQDCKKK